MHPTLEPLASPTRGKPQSSGTSMYTTLHQIYLHVSSLKVYIHRKTGKPYANAIVWNDGRTEDICDRLAEDGGKDRFRATTGLPIAPYFSASKLMYFLQTIPGLREDAEAGDALFGNIDSYLIWKLTGGRGRDYDTCNCSTFLV